MQSKTRKLSGKQQVVSLLVDISREVVECSVLPFSRILQYPNGEINHRLQEAQKQTSSPARALT